MPGPFDTIRAISPDDDFTDFNCGIEDFNDFIQNDAKDDYRRRISVTYVGLIERKPVAFISLIAATFNATLVNKTDFNGDYHYRQFPAIKIARLATTINEQGLGCATTLLQYAFAVVLRVREMIGCYLVITDALPDRISWYLNHGFILPYSPQTHPDRASYPLYTVLP